MDEAGEIPAEVRQRVEDRFADTRWRIWVCAEPDGDRCGSGTLGAGYHHCAAGEGFRRGHGSKPIVVWIEVAPAGESGK